MEQYCHYCKQRLEEKYHNKSTSTICVECVCCFKTELLYEYDNDNKYKLLKANLIGDKCSGHLGLYFSNNPSCVCRINLTKSITISDKPYSYEECIDFLNKFDKVKIFI